MEPPKLDPELLEMLRCPVGMRLDDEGDDPGALQVAHDGWWLVCEASGYKYPVRDGFPHMLLHIGQKYKDTPVESLPVPPPVQD